LGEKGAWQMSSAFIKFKPHRKRSGGQVCLYSLGNGFNIWLFDLLQYFVCFIDNPYETTAPEDFLKLIEADKEIVLFVPFREDEHGRIILLTKTSGIVLSKGQWEKLQSGIPDDIKRTLVP
jgi:hypothetical protein